MENTVECYNEIRNKKMEIQAATEYTLTMMDDIHMPLHQHVDGQTIE